MKHARKRPAHRLRRRPPFFHPVPLRSRRDGWTVHRQCGFLAQLYLTGSVREAARRVGMSRASAYRLRARAGAEGFAAAWDHVLAPPGAGRLARRRRDFRPDFRKVTLEALLRRAETGLAQPVLYRGAFRSIREKPDNSALFRLLGRADALAARGARAGAGKAAEISETGVVGVTPAGVGESHVSSYVAPVQAGANRAADDAPALPDTNPARQDGLLDPANRGWAPAGAGATDWPRQRQQTPACARGNGTTRPAGLTERAECSPSPGDASGGIA